MSSMSMCTAAVGKQELCREIDKQEVKKRTTWLKCGMAAGIDGITAAMAILQGELSEGVRD